MQNYNKIISALAISAIGLLVFQTFTYSVYAQSSDCHTRFIFAWHTLNPVLECFNDNIGGGDCSNVGVSTEICLENGNNELKTIVGVNGITVTNNTNTVIVNPSWQLLCQSTLATTATSISCSNFGDRDYLLVETLLKTDVNVVTVGMQFNGDTSNNYSWRRSPNGGADATATSDSDCFLISLNANGGGYMVFDIVNNHDIRKLSISKQISDLSNGATSAPSKVEQSCKWDNTTDAITTITFMTAGTDYDAGSKITVWGYN